MSERFPLTDTRRNALLEVWRGYLLDGPELTAAAWLLGAGLIERAPSHNPADPVAKRAYVLTTLGRKVVEDV